MPAAESSHSAMNETRACAAARQTTERCAGMRMKIKREQFKAFTKQANIL